MRRRKQDSLSGEEASWEQHFGVSSPFFFFFFFRGSLRRDAFRKPPYVSRESFSNLRKTGLFRENGWRIQRGPFFLLRGGGREKRDRCLPFPPHHPLPPDVCRTSGEGRLHDRGFMREHQTSPGDQTGYRRLYTARHWRRLLVPGSGRRGVSPPRRHEFHLYTVYYPVGGCRNNGCFSRATKATKVFAASPAASSTYLTRGYVSSSLSLHEERVEFDRVPISPLHVSRPDDSI